MWISLLLLHLLYKEWATVLSLRCVCSQTNLFVTLPKSSPSGASLYRMTLGHISYEPSAQWHHVNCSNSRQAINNYKADSAVKMNNATLTIGLANHWCARPWDYQNDVTPVCFIRSIEAKFVLMWIICIPSRNNIGHLHLLFVPCVHSSGKWFSEYFEYPPYSIFLCMAPNHLVYITCKSFIITRSTQVSFPLMKVLRCFARSWR